MYSMFTFSQITIDIETMSERHHQLQDTIPQHCGEPTTGRRSECVLLQVWKNTIHISCNPPLPPPALHISEDDVRQVFRKNKRRKALGPDGVKPAWKPEISSGDGSIIN